MYVCLFQDFLLHCDYYVIKEKLKNEMETKKNCHTYYDDFWQFNIKKKRKKQSPITHMIIIINDHNWSNERWLNGNKYIWHWPSCSHNQIRKESIHLSVCACVCVFATRHIIDQLNEMKWKKTVECKKKDQIKIFIWFLLDFFLP